MASITTWMRLEPRARTRAMKDALGATWCDPAWALARQWQFGAFLGEDAGSPVIATLEADRGLLTRYHAGRPGATSVTGQVYNLSTIPLETLVERETMKPERDVRAGAAAGFEFLERLRAAQLTRDYRSDYVDAYPIAPPDDEDRQHEDGETLRLWQVVAGRAPDGSELYNELHQRLEVDDAGLPEDKPRIEDNNDRAAIEEAARAWLRWYREMNQPEVGTGSPWVSQRMEYEFAVSARLQSGELVLTGPEYAHGHLDWYSFDRHPTASLGGSADPAPPKMTRSVIPTPVAFRGMPSARLWEIEDGNVNLGAIEAGPQDLARMLLIEFALVYGNDHFVIPIDLKVGSVCRITSLVVTNTFGDITTIPSAEAADGAGGQWRMYTVSPDLRGVTTAPTPDAPVFVLPPALGPSLHSEAVEEVLFLRDEMANMAWAVERVVQGPSGRPLRRFEAYQEKRQREDDAGGGTASESTADLVYRLASEVPDYWYPLLPVLVDQRSICLRLGAMPGEQPSTTDGPRGRILAAAVPLLIPEEEVPRAGARVTRAYQYARWIDGSSHLWIGRRKQPGRGEGSSGLRFDTIRAP
jgi:hypothetical protein